MRHGKYPFIIGFLVAPVTLYVVFVICAVRPGVLHRDDQLARALAPTPSSSGCDNFERLLEDDVFWKAVRHHGVLLLALPLITIAIALFFAFLLNVGGRQPRAARSRGLGVEVLPGGVLLPPGPGRRHRRRCMFGRSTGPTTAA